jgi:hypothetical protein
MAMESKVQEIFGDFCAKRSNLIAEEFTSVAIAAARAHLELPLALDN